MKYKFSSDLQMNYSELAKYIPDNKEITKEELLERCSGEISLDLLQSIKELEFSKIGKNKDEQLYLI